VYLFDDYRLGKVQRSVDALEREFNSRKEHMGERNEMAGAARIAALRAVLMTCDEPAPEQ
jgi:hypothetical protein